MARHANWASDLIVEGIEPLDFFQCPIEAPPILVFRVYNLTQHNGYIASPLGAPTVDCRPRLYLVSES